MFRLHCLSAFSPHRTYDKNPHNRRRVDVSIAFRRSALIGQQRRILNARHQLKVSIAFRRSALIGREHPEPRGFIRKVSIAFRRSALIGPGRGKMSPPRLACLHCLSAFSPHRTAHTFHHNLTKTPRLHCLSAFSPHRTGWTNIYSGVGTNTSPLPFGVQPSSDFSVVQRV